jgi:hypothetical protein
MEKRTGIAALAPRGAALVDPRIHAQFNTGTRAAAIGEGAAASGTVGCWTATTLMQRFCGACKAFVANDQDFGANVG